MSIEQVQRVLRSRGIKGAAKSVLFVMAWYAAKDGSKVYPSVKRIADEAGVSERTVQLSIDQLRKAGWLKLVEDSSGGVRTKVYKLVIPVQPLHRCNDDTGAATAPLPVQPLHPTGAESVISPVQPLHPIRHPEETSVRRHPDPDARATPGSPDGPGAPLGNGSARTWTPPPLSEDTLRFRAAIAELAARKALKP